MLILFWLFRIIFYFNPLDLFYIIFRGQILTKNTLI